MTVLWELTNFFSMIWISRLTALLAISRAGHETDVNEIIRAKGMSP